MNENVDNNALLLEQQQTVQHCSASIKSAVEEFEAADYTVFFTSTIGGSFKLEAVLQQLRTTCKMLVLTFLRRCIAHGIAQLSFKSFILWFKLVICDQSYTKYLIEFMQRLDENSKPSSMNVYLCAYIKSARWVVDHIMKASHVRRLQSSIDRFDRLVKGFRTGLQRSIRLQIQRKDSSIATAIRKRRYPAGGLPQLQQAVDDKMPEALAMAQAVSTGATKLSAVLYTFIISVLFCAIYVYAPNARVGGTY
jgi:hypothetical protein